MKTFTIHLKDEFPLSTSQDPRLDCYLVDNDIEVDPNRKHPSILVIPGGGYGMVSFREGEPIALNYLSAGYNVFVLKYSVKPERYPASFSEASASMALIRRNAEKWAVDENKIAAIGFSAGGHLAGCLGTIWNTPDVCDKLDISFGENRPNALILCYPVISSDISVAHIGSFNALLGDNSTPEEKELFSLDKRVTAETPPTFLWHTADDSCVPVANSLRFAESLAKNNIPYELHIYPHGAHGLANCDITTASSPNNEWQISPYCKPWLAQSKMFLSEICGF